MFWIVYYGQMKPGKLYWKYFTRNSKIGKQLSGNHYYGIICLTCNILFCIFVTITVHPIRFMDVKHIMHC